MAEDTSPPRRRAGLGRLLAALALGVALAMAAYVLLALTLGELGSPANSYVSFTFLLLLPSALSAVVAVVADPWREKSLGQYLLVPVWLVLLVIPVALLVVEEGVICVLMLAPLWLTSGMLATWITFRLRRRLGDGRRFCAAVLVIPLLAFQAEPHIQHPAATAMVSRSILVEAPAEAIWPLALGMPDLAPDEGRWNLTQDVIGVPRPRGARLIGEGIGASRLAEWERGVRFAEVVTEWEPERRIGWRFDFAGSQGWEMTDPHLRPDSTYFRVTSGGYRLEPLGPGLTRVTLETRYWMRTPVNAYARAWGELVLGDLQGNLLAIIKARAEG